MYLQAREAELEQTVQELNAALVASRGNDRLSSNGSGGSAIGDASVEARVKALEVDLDTANSHLALERERVRTIKMVITVFSNGLISHWFLSFRLPAVE